MRRVRLNKGALVCRAAKKSCNRYKLPTNRKCAACDRTREQLEVRNKTKRKNKNTRSVSRLRGHVLRDPAEGEVSGPGGSQVAGSEGEGSLWKDENDNDNGNISMTTFGRSTRAA